MADNVITDYSSMQKLRVYEAHPLKDNISGASLSISTIQKYIQYNETRKTRMINDYERFTAAKVPIFNRQIGYLDSSGKIIESPYKINRKLNNDFAGYIVRTKASYLCSNPVNIEFRDLKEIEEDKFNDILLELDNFKKINNWDGLLVETAERIGATGEGAWIISMDNVDGEGIEKINNVYPWEIIEVIKDHLYIRNYMTTNIELEEVYYIDVYDDTSITTYESVAGGSYKKIGTVKHLFKKCPVITFINNDEAASDFHNVKSLMDQYDRTLSDIASEVEQFRLSYLVLTGVDATPEQVSAFQQTGVFQIKKPEGKAEFIIKKMAITETLTLLEKIEKNIFRFAESFDSTSSDYTGDLTSFAIHFKTAPMQGRAKKTANFMKMGLHKSFGIIQDTWSLKGFDVDHYDMDFVFTYDEARNIKEEVETIVAAGGRISNETLLSLMSFIDSPSNEIMRIKNEQSEQGLYTGMEGIWYNQFNQMEQAMAQGNNNPMEQQQKESEKKDKEDK